MLYDRAVATTLPPAPLILVIEDDAPLRELYRSLLRQTGYTVVALGDGLSALRWIEERRPTAVVLDLVLPRLSGRDVYQELQAHPETRSIPIVVVSGDDVSDLNEADFACVLRKPVSPDQFVAAVQDSIGRSRHGGR